MADRRRLVIASGNAGKLREYRELLAGAGFELVAFDSEVEEVGATYVENARLKAETACNRSGLPSLGDDSGVEVEALGGFPGLHSARLAPTQEARTAELFVPEWRGKAGFGYDPIFLVPGTGKTFGEMPPEEKRLYSHRAGAVRALLESGALNRLPA